MTLNCDKCCEKKFIYHIKNGSYCNDCNKKIIYEKTKKTNIEKYGVSTPLMSYQVIEKIKQTNLEKYGVENPFSSKDIMEKIKQTNLEKYGVEHPMCSNEIKNKIKLSNLEKYGVENPAMLKEVQEKMKKTNLEKYGVENALQSKDIQEKMKKTNLEKYGVENTFQAEEFKEKMKKTNLEKYGVVSPLQSKEIQEKKKKTNLEKYGVENPASLQEVQEKMKKTNLEKYGVEYPNQNTDMMNINMTKTFKLKEYKLPSGNIIKIQGYENYALDELLNLFDENDIKTGALNVPNIWYNDENNIKHRHYVDIYIESIKKCIEIKSEWTLKLHTQKVFLKQNAGKSLGYDYEIWVYNGKGEKINTYK